MGANFAIVQSLREESLTLYRKVGDKDAIAWPLESMAEIACIQGAYRRVLTLHEESLALAKVLDNNWLTAFCLEGLAITVAAQREETWAARLWGTAEALLESSGVALTPFERAAYEPAVAAAHAQLSEKAFATAWQERRAMTPEQAFLAREPPMVFTPVPVVETPTPLVKKSQAYPAGLTAREVEILRQVAQG